MNLLKKKKAIGEGDNRTYYFLLKYTTYNNIYIRIQVIFLRHKEGVTPPFYIVIIKYNYYNIYIPFNYIIFFIYCQAKEKGGYNKPPLVFWLDIPVYARSINNGKAQSGF